MEIIPNVIMNSMASVANAYLVLKILLMEMVVLILMNVVNWTMFVLLMLDAQIQSEDTLVTAMLDIKVF